MNESVTFEPSKPTIKKRTEGEQVRGMLMKVECPGGESGVFHVKAGERVYKLHAQTLGNIELVAYVQDAGSEITCGVRKPENLVIVTFRPNKTPRSKFDGELIAVDFITPDMEMEK